MTVLKSVCEHNPSVLASFWRILFKKVMGFPRVLNYKSRSIPQGYSQQLILDSMITHRRWHCCSCAMKLQQKNRVLNIMVNLFLSLSLSLIFRTKVSNPFVYDGKWHCEKLNRGWSEQDISCHAKFPEIFSLIHHWSLYVSCQTYFLSQEELWSKDSRSFREVQSLTLQSLYKKTRDNCDKKWEWGGKSTLRKLCEKSVVV